MKILLTSTSFQDSPGRHHKMLDDTGFSVDRLRGPLPEKDLLGIIHLYDGIICSDDQYTEEVIKLGAEGKLKIISKYGVGLDSINLEAARKYGVKVTNCPDVNQVTVAEHVFALLLTFFRNVHHEYNATTMQGKWIRTIGHDLYGKHLGIVGLGRIGKELAKRALAFGLTVSTYDPCIDEDFIATHGISRFNELAEMTSACDIISLHLPLKKETEKIISAGIISNHIKKGLYLVNTSRAKLVDCEALVHALKSGHIAGYLTDVAEVEPIEKDHPLIGMENVIITSHVGSRTYENIERQGVIAVKNLISGYK
jgi:D-3-phosphoglycerate dehydrogenase / 2-oxoglutarate reductase